MQEKKIDRKKRQTVDTDSAFGCSAAKLYGVRAELYYLT